MAVAAAPPRPAADPNQCLHWCAWALVAIALLLLGVLSQRVERTPDELNYQLAGRALLARQGLTTIEQRFQGPVILLGTQLTDAPGKATDDVLLRRARLGMLVFPAVLLVVLVLWARRALGARAACGVAWLAATNPTLLAYAPLLSSDVAFTAMGVLAAWLVWRWLQAPGPGSLAAAGVGLGLFAGTKYTAVIPLAGLVLAVLVATARGFDAWPRRDGIPRGVLARLGGAAAAMLAAAALALGTLYAAYLFAIGPFPAAAVGELTSPALRALAAAPGGTLLLGLLPEALVRGIDYQAVWAGTTSLGSFGAQLGNHVAYYPLTVLVKSPLPLLAAAALGVWCLARVRAPRGTWLLALLPPALLLAYCSATRALQMGMRYVLPVVPALWLLGGAFVASAWARTRAGLCVLAALAAASAWNVVAGWPHFVGFFNLAAGGPANGHRLCADGNLDWDQRYETGQHALRARHPDVVFLPPGAGPRFGTVAAYTQDLKAADPRDATRCYHWLTRFAPVDRDGAAWLVYAVTPAAFAAAVAAGDRRAAEDLALAWLRDGDVAAARQALATVSGAAADPNVAATASLIEAIADAGADPARRDAVAEQCTAAGHFELALALTDRGKRANATKVFWLLTRTGAQRDAVDFLERAGADGSRTTEEVVLLAASLYDGGRHYLPQPMRALELMQRGPAPAADSPGIAVWRELEARVRAAVERERRLEGER